MGNDAVSDKEGQRPGQQVPAPVDAAAVTPGAPVTPGALSTPPSLPPSEPSPSPRLSAPLWLLVLVTLSGTMAMHIFIPALPLAGAALQAPAASMQQTITLYVLGLAFGQLIYGPVSDTLGRRPALMVGLGLYLSASLVALWAPTLEWLLAARLVQALGGAAGITLGRTIVRDTVAPERVAKELALLNLLTLVGPGLSPIVGSYLAGHFGWRAIYLFLVFMGCAMLVCAWRLLPETLPQRRPLGVAAIARDFRTLLSTPRFLGYMLGGACVTTALYPYLATAPYIVHGQLGRPIEQIGWFAAVCVVGASIGTMITRRLAGGRVAGQTLLYIGTGLALCMALVFVGLQWWGALTAPALVVVMVLMLVGAGMSSPVALARSMGAVPWLTGSAAGLYGFSQMAVGALGTRLVGYGDDPALACALTQIGLLVTSVLCIRWAGRHPVLTQPARL